MELLTIKIQSCTDMITNSSSEIFMLHTEKTAEQVEEALSEFTEGYFKPLLFNLEDYRKHRHDYDIKYRELRKKFEDKDGRIPDFNAFWNEVEQFRRENRDLFIYDTMEGWFIDSEDPNDIFMCQKQYLLPYWEDEDNLDELQIEFKNMIKSKVIKENEYGFIYYGDIPDEIFKEFINTHNLPNIKDIIKTYCGFYNDVVELDGCIIVLSEYDNSIPYEDFDKIEKMFNANRYHLG